MRKWFALLLCLMFFLINTASAESISGLSYEAFLANYADNLNFINDNASRHLLPLIPAKRDAGWGDGRLFYEIFGDVLSLTIRTNDTGLLIEECTISLTAPPDMSYGSTLHRDFTTSGYQSYGMLMAMSPAETALDRYQMVSEVENGLATGNGVYHKQVGVYSLDAASMDGTVTIVFTNSTAKPTPSPIPSETPEPTATPEPEEQE